MMLYGKNSIIERVKTNPQSIREIFVQDNFNDQNVLKVLKSSGVSVTYVKAKELERMKRADRIQGIVAKVDPFKYACFEDIIAKEKKSNIIFLDGLNDPHNLGSIIRITACLGGFVICIPAHDSCEVNDTVLHVASGGENYVPVCYVTNLIPALEKAKSAGYWVVGTVVEGGQDLTKTSLPFPLCLVLGSEGKGIRPGIQKHLDMNVTLPMHGADLSFNVAMACAIFGYEILRQDVK
ncbi:23S rRNA (guanosine(2251)-2'-O)-methyltransferase RlmB [bacterium]|nr:23S rRNA (guanosine(2251)-2'-O)-methyltransferase RlmB [bacterium]